MTKSPGKSVEDIPVIKGYGGIREAQKKLKGSEVIYQNRDALAHQILEMISTNITDIITWEDGTTRLKDVKDIPPAALAAIRRVRVTPTQSGEQLDLDMHDKVRLIQMAAKAAGLLDQEREVNKPAVIEVQMIAPGGKK